MAGRQVGCQTKVTEYIGVVTSKALAYRESDCIIMLDKFWWSHDYLCNIPPSVHRFEARGHINEGSVVLIREDNMPRLQWPVGVVERNIKSPDRVVCSVSLRTAKG